MALEHRQHRLGDFPALGTICKELRGVIDELCSPESLELDRVTPCSGSDVDHLQPRSTSPLWFMPASATTRGSAAVATDRSAIFSSRAMSVIEADHFICNPRGSATVTQCGADI